MTTDARELIVDTQTSFRVDRRAYTDPSLFALERERIFETCWIYACHASELPSPGDFVTRHVAGRDLILVRDADNELRALLNVCTHRGSRVCLEPCGNATSFRCPYHAWTFDTRGELRGLPGAERYPKPPRADLHRVRLETYRDFAFVTLSPSAPPLVDYLAGATEHLDLVVDQSLGAGMEIVPGTHRYDIRANWKLLGENSIDAYHVQVLHRRFLDYVAEHGVRKTRPAGRSIALGNGHAVTESSPPISCKPIAYWGPPMPLSMKPSILAMQARLRDAYGDERAHQIHSTYRQLQIFPNLIVVDTTAITIRTWDPIAIDRIATTAWALAPRGQDAELRAISLAGFLTFFGPGGFASPDDIEILELVQRGFANKEQRFVDFSRGIASPDPAYDDELPQREFWREWRRWMEAVR
ncbi:MAG: Rieske 2Fe-2S domain-containing protein [Kofleriaceae bacterium]